MDSPGPLIEASHLCKRYTLFEQPSDRLKQMVLGGLARLGGRALGWNPPRLYREFHALDDVSLSIGRGEVVGIIGRNGAGKSTLLQLICGTLQPSAGTVVVQGRIAALLELGAGFNPDFTGRENVVMAASILGLSAAETRRRMDAIIAFAGIGDFIDQPVKTYSSGMFVRLAFSVATSIDPDILVVDEALSVGDGEFSRRSFDRIMALKDRGATILFCSHSMYHIQALCSRALWMENGRVRMLGDAATVTAAYETALVLSSADRHDPELIAQDDQSTRTQASFDSKSGILEAVAVPRVEPGTARLLGVEVLADGVRGRELAVHSSQTHLTLTLRFASDPALACPSVAMGFLHANGSPVASAGSVNDGVTLTRDAHGVGQATLSFPRLPLLKGDYTINVFLLCERGLHVYDHAERVATLRVVQQGLEQGLVTLPHAWDTQAGGGS